MPVQLECTTRRVQHSRTSLTTQSRCARWRPHENSVLSLATTARSSQRTASRKLLVNVSPGTTSLLYLRAAVRDYEDELNETYVICTSYSASQAWTLRKSSLGQQKLLYYYRVVCFVNTRVQLNGQLSLCEDDENSYCANANPDSILGDIDSLTTLSSEMQWQGAREHPIIALLALSPLSHPGALTTRLDLASDVLWQAAKRRHSRLGPLGCLGPHQPPEALRWE